MERRRGRVTMGHCYMLPATLSLIADCRSLVRSMASKYVTSPVKHFHANQRDESRDSPGQDESETKDAGGTYNIDTPSKNQVLPRSSSTVSEIKATAGNCATYIKKKTTEFVKYEMGDFQQVNPKVRLDDAYTEDGDEIFVETELDMIKPQNVATTVISPLHPWKNQWDFLIIVLVLYNAIFIPVAIGFPSYEGESALFGYFIDSLFILDIFLSFRTAYVMENGEINWDPKSIRQNYLKTWFTIDLIASIPLEVFVLMFSSQNDGVDSSQLQLKLLLRMLKLPRLFRMGRIFKYLEKFKYASTMRIIRLLVGYVLAGHWVACGFLFVCRLQDPTETITYLHDIHDKQLIRQYMATLRTSFFFFAGENVEVNTLPEEVYATIFFVLGNVLSAVLIGNIGVVLANRNIMASEHQRKKQSLGVTLRTMKIPLYLQNRVIEYYEYLWNRHRRNDVRYDFTQELSDDLRKQVQLVLNKEAISKNPIFQSCSLPAIMAMLDKLQTQIYLRGDCMVRLGDIGNEMYFLVKGKAAVIIASGQQVAILEDGSYFGELALATKQRRNAHVVARTNCDVRILDKQSFDTLCLEFPEIAKNFQHHTKMKYSNAANMSRRQSIDASKGFSHRLNTKNGISKEPVTADDSGSDSEKAKYNQSSLNDKDVKQLAFRLETAMSKLDSYIYLLQGVVPKNISSVKLVDRLDRLEEKVDRLFNVTYHQSANSPSTRNIMESKTRENLDDRSEL